MDVNIGEAKIPVKWHYYLLKNIEMKIYDVLYCLDGEHILIPTVM